MGSLTTGTSPLVLGAMRPDRRASELLVAGSPGRKLSNHGSPRGPSKSKGFGPVKVGCTGCDVGWCSCGCTLGRLSVDGRDAQVKCFGYSCQGSDLGGVRALGCCLGGGGGVGVPCCSSSSGLTALPVRVTTATEGFSAVGILTTDFCTSPARETAATAPPRLAR